jgi:long-chain acyl-CoA synthetase
MTEPRRLFDCLEVQQQMGGLDAMLAAKEGGKWRQYSTAEVVTLVDQLAAGLLSLGISANDMSVDGRDKVAVIAKNRPEWIILDLAIQKIGAVLVPVYPTVHIADLAFVLNDAQVKMLFVNDEDLFRKVETVLPQTPSLKHIFSFEPAQDCAYWKDLLQMGSQEHYQQLETAAARINTEDLLTLIYTSGTTSTPKGVMLSHHNILSNVMASIPVFPPGENMRSLSFLPLNHIFERMVTYIYLFKGTSIWYAEGMETIGDNLKEVKPHLFTTVPRLLEKVYDKIMQKGTELTGLKKKLFYWAHDLATRFEINTQQDWWYRTQLGIANKLVFSKWREALGGNLTCIVTGGAACQVRLIRIFTAAQIPIMEGYGLTETSPVISVNRFQEWGRRFGTVGPLIDGVEVRIAEDGEILTKGPHVMMGYYKRLDLTAEAIKDGWFYTGDIGTLDGDNFLKITDRKKELFKTSGGKYVAPLPIENKLKESPFVEQVMIVGADRKFVGALIVPSFMNLRDWARNHNLSGLTNEQLVQHPKVRELYKGLVDSFNAYFSQVEQVKRFELLAQEWSVDGGEMTPKLSLKRKVVMEKYAGAVELIYDAGKVADRV